MFDDILHLGEEADRSDLANSISFSAHYWLASSHTNSMSSHNPLYFPNSPPLPPGILPVSDGSGGGSLFQLSIWRSCVILSKRAQDIVTAKSLQGLLQLPPQGLSGPKTLVWPSVPLVPEAPYIDGLSIDVSADRGSRGRGVGHRVSACLTDVNLRDGDFQSFAGHL